MKLVDASEGEHGNVKPPNGKDRVFVLGQHDSGTVSEANGELVIAFEFRPATLQDWRTTDDGLLALVIVFDQFPRNMFRNDARTYATDALARRTGALLRLRHYRVIR